MLQGSYADAIEYSERALQLAAELDLPAPARAFAARGGARCSLGEPDGLDDDREALRLFVDSGDSASVTRGYNNYAIDTLFFNGPLAALDVIADGAAFAAQRGLTHAAASTEETRVGFLFMSGRLDEALEITERSLTLSAASGDLVSHFDALAFRTIALAEQGDVRPADAERALARLASWVTWML
jgi:tetratricopeptide (TPR) repeat protein